MVGSILGMFAARAPGRGFDERAVKFNISKFNVKLTVKLNVKHFFHLTVKSRTLPLGLRGLSVLVVAGEVPVIK